MSWPRSASATRWFCLRCAWAVIAVVSLMVGPRQALALRPFDSTDADVTDAGKVELEFGPLGGLRQGSSKFLVAPAVVANFGLSNDREVVLEGRGETPVGPSRDSSQTVFGDTKLSLKQVHRRGNLQDGTGPSLASECAILLPEINGASGTGAGCVGILSHRVPWAMAHLNAGAFFDREQNWGRVLGLIIEGPYEWAVRPGAELLIERNNSGAWSDGLLIGAIWRVQDNLALDVAVRAARTDTGPLHEWRAGFTWAFQTGW